MPLLICIYTQGTGKGIGHACVRGSFRCLWLNNEVRVLGGTGFATANKWQEKIRNYFILRWQVKHCIRNKL